ncbi:MAG TPA: glycosyltransferase family 39 protein [Candidatus Krumholzibacteria bacterium]|nr:glycosyltransferase family 39 protein [Candidatus Krumholzibacteria bacterium]
MKDRYPASATGASPYEARALIAIVFAAALLRLFRLGYQSLWVDELFTLIVATPKPGYPIGQLLLHNIHGPLHTFVVYLCRSVSEADAWLRLPSALAGVVAVPLVYAWVRPRLGARVALWAAFLLAVSPLHVHYSQELRNYAFAVCFVLAACVQLDRLVADWSRRRAVGLAVLVAASVLCNFSAAFVFVAQTFTFFRADGLSRRSLRRWAAVAGLALVLMSPWIYRVTTYVDLQKLATPVMPGELEPGERLRGETTFRLESIPYAAYGYSAGLALGPSLRELHTDASLATVLRRHFVVVAWVALVFAAPFLLGLRAVLRRRGRWGVAEIALYTAVPLACTLFLNWQNAKAFNVRYVIVGLPAYLTFVAAGVGSLGGVRRWMSGGLVALTCAWSLGNHYFNPRYAKEDVKRALVETERRMRPGDCLFAPTVWQVVEHYQRVDAPVHYVFAAAPEAGAAQLAEMFATCPTFWYLRARPWVDDPAGVLRARIEARCDVVDRFERPGVEVIEYRVRHAGDGE